MPRVPWTRLGLVLLLALAAFVLAAPTLRLDGLPLAGHGLRMELGLDLAGGLDLLYAVRPPAAAAPELAPRAPLAELAARARDVLADRVDELGLAGATVQVQGERSGQIRVQVPASDLATQKRVKEILCVSSMLQFHEVLEEGASPADLDGARDDAIVRPGAGGGGGAPGRAVSLRVWYLLRRAPELTGEDLAFAGVVSGPLGEPEVQFELTDAGAARAAQATRRLIGRRLAIVVGGRVHMAPTVEGPFDRHGRIAGGIDRDEAARAVRLLRAGSLPVELEPLSECAVGPTLGGDTVRQGLRAALLGGALVAAFVLAWYRAAGALALAALAVNLVGQVAVLAVLGATLTLPGIAGFALTAGMAVDSNVLVFERIRDELRAGKTARAALAAGYQKAFTALVDAHATSMITGAVLYLFGSAPVRGFAVTLVVGLAVNLVTATWVTRTLQELDPSRTLPRVA
jgi:protein-export membrane protein SecD